MLCSLPSVRVSGDVFDRSRVFWQSEQLFAYTRIQGMVDKKAGGYGEKLELFLIASGATIGAVPVRE
jgi:hypothetical protein